MLVRVLFGLFMFCLTMGVWCVYTSSYAAAVSFGLGAVGWGIALVNSVGGE